MCVCVYVYRMKRIYKHTQQVMLIKSAAHTKLGDIENIFSDRNRIPNISSDVTSFRKTSVITHPLQVCFQHPSFLRAWIYSSVFYSACLPWKALYSQAIARVSVFPVPYTVLNECLLKELVMMTHNERLKLSSWNLIRINTQPYHWTPPLKKLNKHKIVNRWLTHSMHKKEIRFLDKNKPTLKQCDITALPFPLPNSTNVISIWLNKSIWHVKQRICETPSDLIRPCLSYYLKVPNGTFQGWNWQKKNCSKKS